ncbi:MAG TPA: phage holin family protein [Candidatus Kapabacteria bacterium]|nr:phage holin family protein [Candidatus Kapabacteria bacterium]
MEHEDLGIEEWAKWIGATAAAVWAWLPGPEQLLLLLQTADILTGVMLAWKRKRVASGAMTKGLWAKAGIWVMVGLAGSMEGQLGVPLAASVCAWYAVKEAISVVENAARLGAPVPPPMRRALAALREKEKKEDVRGS